MNTEVNNTQQEEDLVSAYQFAERKNPKVSATAVYNKIKAGIIESINIAGRDLIDWNKFKDVEFQPNRRKNKAQTNVEE